MPTSTSRQNAEANGGYAAEDEKTHLMRMGQHGRIKVVSDATDVAANIGIAAIAA